MQWWEWSLIAVGVTLVAHAAFVLVLVAVGRRNDAHASARLVPDCVVLVSRLIRDRRVPRRRKLLLLALGAYLVLPFDVVPDFIPVAGQLDDATLVALVLRHLVRAQGAGLVRELWPGPERSVELVLGLVKPA